MSKTTDVRYSRFRIHQGNYVSEGTFVVFDSNALSNDARLPVSIAYCLNSDQAVRLAKLLNLADDAGLIEKM